MSKSQGNTFNLGLEMAPPRIIATHGRKSSEWKLDTILEDYPMAPGFTPTGSPTGSNEEGTSSPSVRQRRFGAELTRLAGFPAPITKD